MKNLTTYSFDYPNRTDDAADSRCVICNRDNT